MADAENKLRLRGIERVSLFIEENNSKVIEFYKKNGWHILYNTVSMEKDITLNKNLYK